jgi:hypothetical protein
VILPASSFSLPGKTFLLGEYAILEGGEALLLGHGPGFEAGLRPGTLGHAFHPDSPAGRWIAGQLSVPAFEFIDHFRGLGGFGGSGAEFLAAFAAVHGVPETVKERINFAWAAWDASREFPGSGADILTQAFGVNFAEAFWLGVDIPGRRLETFAPKFGATLSLFHTGKKLATHSHLENLPPIPSEALTHLVWDGQEALRSRSLKNFAAALSTYAAILSELKLVAPHTAEALSTLPKGILAAKGCGAMGADVIAVLHPKLALDAWAKANSLAEIQRLPV